MFTLSTDFIILMYTQFDDQCRQSNVLPVNSGVVSGTSNSGMISIAKSGGFELNFNFKS